MFKKLKNASQLVISASASFVTGYAEGYIEAQAKAGYEAPVMLKIYRTSRRCLILALGTSEAENLVTGWGMPKR